MDQLSNLFAQLENWEFWINVHYNNKVCITLQDIEGAIKKRHRILKRILRLQIREFKRD